MNRHERRCTEKADRQGHIDKLRKAAATIPAAQAFSLDLGNGQTFTTSGQDLIDTAEGFLTLFDAIDRGDDARARAAAHALGLLPQYVHAGRTQETH